MAEELQKLLGCAVLLHYNNFRLFCLFCNASVICISFALRCHICFITEIIGNNRRITETSRLRRLLHYNNFRLFCLFCNASVINISRGGRCLLYTLYRLRRRGRSHTYLR